MMGMRSLFVLALLGTQSAFAADGQPQVDTPELRQRAEDLARAASQRFTDILDEKKKPASTGAAAPAAQPPAPRETAGALSPVFDWLEHSAQSYEHVVIAQLKAKDDWTTIVESSSETAKPAATAPPPELRGWNGLLEHVRDWLGRASRAYRTQIVTPLSTPDAGSVPAAQPSVAASTTGNPPPGTAGDHALEEEKIKREAEAADRERRQTEAAARVTAETEAARLADQEAADARHRAEEEKRVAAAAEEKRKAQAEARARLIEEAEAKRRADDDKRKALAAEVRRIADEAEAKRVAIENANRLAQAEAKRKSDETRKQADEADAAERIAVAQAEADAKRTAEIEAEATRRMRAAAADKQGGSAREVAPSSSSPPGMSTGPSGPGLVPPRGNGEGDVAKTESEGSSVAIPAAPERKPDEERGAAKAAAKSREDAIEDAAQPAPVTPKKLNSSKSAKGKKYAYAKKAKRHHASKTTKRSRHAAHKHRLQQGEVVLLERGCACRCGRLFATPRKHRHAARTGFAAPGRYVVRKHRGVRLQHRHGRHYID